MAKSKVKGYVTKKSKKPGSLSIKRSGATFNVSWTGSYESQNYKNKWNGEKKWGKVSSPNKSTKKASHKVSYGNYYPATNRYLKSLEVAVRGKEKKVAATTKKKGTKYKWSNWATAPFALYAPNAPSVSFELSDSKQYKGTFKWSVSKSDTDQKPFYDTEWQSILIKDSNESNGEKIAFSNATDGSRMGYASGIGNTSGEILFQENSGLFKNNNSWTRWFRVRSRGCAGASGWRYAKHVYALPYKARDVKGVAKYTDEGGTGVSATWRQSMPNSHPIDNVAIEWAMAEPVGSSLKIPSGASWKAGAQQGARETDAENENDVNATFFTLDDTLDDDQILYVRVNNEYDKKDEYGTTYGDASPILVNDSFYGYLKAPSGLSLSNINEQTHRVTVTAKNNSGVSDAFLVVLFKTAEQPDQPYIVGIMDDEESITVQAPDWSNNTAYSFGVYAAVGIYTELEREDGVGSYEVDAKMISKSTIWKGGTVPVAPKNVSVTATEISGTIRAAWDWSWKDADTAELSWADHSDAWESTDEPSNYEVGNTNAAQWNISGLETGKKWYVRVRLKRTTGDTETTGPWSDIVEIDLASAPVTPSLVLSDSVITVDGEVTASWGYSTTDGTAQAQAEITTAVINANGIRYGQYTLTQDEEVVSGKEYYQLTDGVYVPVSNPSSTSGLYEIVDNIIARVETAQHVTLNAQELGWVAGNTYNLCVRVISASGKTSDNWSNPVSVIVADPLVAKITQTSLVPMSILNPDGLTEDVIMVDTLPSEVLSFDVSADMFVGAGMTYGDYTLAYTRTEETVDDVPVETRSWTLTGVEGTLSENEVMALGIAVEYADGTNSASVSFKLESKVATTEINALRAMPFTATATGAGAGCTTAYAIERVGSFHAAKPDESDVNGQDGETVALVNGIGEQQVTINVEDLIGSLDDEGKYRLVVTVQDGLGQSAQDSVEFEVHWAHQAIIPDADYEIDDENMVAYITPIAPEGMETGDVADIYRLSTDKPELITPSAAWGTKYVDPYPAIGENGGYRVVFRTANGDFVTEDKENAWVDLDAEILDTEYNLIDFDGNTIQLYYNVDYSSSWEKDFTETRYLGGSVHGDWNAVVGRSGSISTVMLPLTDMDTIEMMRRLAVHTGICHVRTRDGSSYAADIQVSEDRSHEDREMVASFSMSITRVDPEEYDGMTYEEWLAMQEEE